MKILLISMALFGITACGAIEEAERVVTFPYNAYQTYEQRDEIVSQFKYLEETLRKYFQMFINDIEASLQWINEGQIELNKFFIIASNKGEHLEERIREYCNGDLCSGFITKEVFLWCYDATTIGECRFVKPSHITLSPGGIQ